MAWREGEKVKSLLTVGAALKHKRWLFDCGPFQRPIPPRLLGEMMLKSVVKKLAAGHLAKAKEV